MSKNIIILKNTGYLVARTLLISIIGLFTVREILKLLGAEGYGLFNLVFGIAGLFAFINGAMVSSVQRYLSYYIEKKNDELLSNVWRSSLFLHLIFATLISLLLFFFKNIILTKLIYVDNIYLDSVSFVFNLAVISIFINIFQAPFNALVLAKEKMSFYAFLSLYDAISKLLIIYALYYFSDGLLEKYTVLYVASSLFVLIFYILYCYREFNSKINFKITNFIILKEIIVFSSWNIFGNLAAVVKLQGINILLNIFFGLVVNSAYAVTNILINVINGLISSITTAINPQIYKTYASGDFNRNILLINIGSKYSFFLCLLVVYPILFNTSYLLTLWLDTVPEYLVTFIQISLFVLLVDCLSGTLMTGIQSTGKVKLYQIVVSISVFLNLPLSYISLKFFMEPWIVFFVALMMSFISLGLRLYFLSRLTEFSIMIYVKSVLLKIILVFIVSFLSSYVFLKLLNMQSLVVSFFVSSIFMVLVVLVCIVLFGFSSIERQLVQAKIKGYLK